MYATRVANYTQHSPDGIKADRIVTHGGGATVAVPTVVETKAEDPDAHLSAEQKVMKKRLEIAESARQAEIARMPVRLREALMLVTIEGRSQAEAADLLGTTEKAIETRVYRARNRLKERFEKL